MEIGNIDGSTNTQTRDNKHFFFYVDSGGKRTHSGRLEVKFYVYDDFVSI